MLNNLKQDLQQLSNPVKAQQAKRFFKTGKGEYGEGDLFLGITVPEQKKIAKKYKDLSLEDTITLLKSPYHEHRLTALFILVQHFKTQPQKVYELYLNNTTYVNNWDLVDSSAHKIVGAYLLDKKRDVLYTLAQSKNLWERRIAIVATFAFIKEGQLEDTLKLATLLLNDKEDLMHKAVGWALREVGKKDQKALETFLHAHASVMPRTALRYAIEKFEENTRKHYLSFRKT